MLVIPNHLKGKDLWCEFGKITLDENMTEEQVLEAQKIHPDIKFIKAEVKVKRKRKGAN